MPIEFTDSERALLVEFRELLAEGGREATMDQVEAHARIVCERFGVIFSANDAEFDFEKIMRIGLAQMREERK